MNASHIISLKRGNRESTVRASVSYDYAKKQERQKLGWNILVFQSDVCNIKIQAPNSWLSDRDNLTNSALIPNILCASLQMSHEGGVCAIIPKEFMQSQEFFYVLFWFAAYLVGLIRWTQHIWYTMQAFIKSY